MSVKPARKNAPRKPKLAAISVVLNGRVAASTGREISPDPSDGAFQSPLHRIQDNLLAQRERRVLNWLCGRMPAWIMPDHLTAIGFLGTLFIVAGYGLSPYDRRWLLLAISGYCVNWFGDSLDGSLARFRKIERPQFGYFVDHSLDAVGNLLTMVGFGLTNFVRMDVALFAAGCYLLLSVHTFLAARVVGAFRLSYGWLGPTELRVILIMITVSMFAFAPTIPEFGGHSAFDVFTTAAALMLLVIFASQTLRVGRSLYRTDLSE